MRLFNFRNIFPFMVIFALVAASCNGDKNPAATPQKAAIEVKTAVVTNRDIKEYQDFNGVTQYLKRKACALISQAISPTCPTSVAVR